MDTEHMIPAIVPALIDSGARERFLADPRAALAATGFRVPEWITVTAIEGDAPELTITLPPMLDTSDELNEETLKLVSGGYLGCDAWKNWPPS